jgi:hypothetical protein
MMDRTVADAALIEAARSIAPLVRACRDEGERERRLSAQVLAAMQIRCRRRRKPGSCSSRRPTAN